MHAETILKDHSIQATASRIAIYDYILTHGGHFTADELESEMNRRLPKITHGTVYNTLSLFVKKGLIKDLNFSCDKKVIYDANTKPHFHFLDVETGELFDVDKNTIDLKLNFEDAVQIEECEVLIKGRLRKD